MVLNVRITVFYRRACIAQSMRSVSPYLLKLVVTHQAQKIWFGVRPHVRTYKREICEHYYENSLRTSSRQSLPKLTQWGKHRLFRANFHRLLSARARNSDNFRIYSLLLLWKMVDEEAEGTPAQNPAAHFSGNIMNFERPKFSARQENRLEALKAFQKKVWIYLQRKPR